MSSNDGETVVIVVDGRRRPIVPENLKERILLAYPSEVLEVHLDSASEEALYVLSQLVWMQFNAENLLRLAQREDNQAIAKICKDNLEGQALLNELQRALTYLALH